MTSNNSPQGSNTGEALRSTLGNKKPAYAGNPTDTFKSKTDKSLNQMSKDERSLLLFLETRAVDYGGRVQVAHMNSDDFEIAEQWKKEGFIDFGRIVARMINRDGTHWVKLSEEAWRLAHQERKARFKRMWEKRTWISTEDSREIFGDPHLSGMNA